jgi:hypothetical protein
MKKTIAFIGLCFTNSFANAQTVTPMVYSNQGGYNVAAGGSISWTVGEPISETYTTSTKMTTMGFHQPELGIATLMKEQGNNASLLVFPNPVKGSLTISFKDLDNGIYKIELMDDLGRSVLKTETEIKQDSKMINIDLSIYAAGNYFIRISNSTLNKTVKINKTY